MTHGMWLYLILFRHIRHYSRQTQVDLKGNFQGRCPCSWLQPHFLPLLSLNSPSLDILQFSVKSIIMSLLKVRIVAIIIADIPILYLKVEYSTPFETHVPLTYLNIHLPFLFLLSIGTFITFIGLLQHLLTKCHPSSFSSHCHCINPARKSLYFEWLGVLPILINPSSFKHSNLSKSVLNFM